jgi:hypothetical protein
MKRHIVHVGCCDLGRSEAETYINEVKAGFKGFFTHPAIYLPNRVDKRVYVETVEMD